MDIVFDPEDPPAEPPPGTPQPLLWCMARQVFADHDVGVDDGGPMVPRCRICDEPWPCRPRRMAEGGLLAACRPAQAAHGPASYLDRFLSTGEESL